MRLDEPWIAPKGRTGRETFPSSKDLATVLVVDDDPVMRMLAGQSLELAGFHVEEAEDGTAALALLRRLRPDLVLLDVEMPGMDGFSVCARLRELPETGGTPILMMTGLDDLESINRAYEVGATDFVTKPPNWVILGHRARYMIRASRSAEALRRTAEDLRRSEGKLANAQRIASLGWWEWDVEAEAFSGSDEFYRILGSSPDSSAAGLDRLIRPVHDEDKGRVEALVREAAQSGAPFGIEHRIVRSDGATRIVHHQTEVAVDGNGKATRLTGTVQDITERKQDEERIRHLAFFDSLTGLPNRWYLADRLKLAVEAAKRQGRVVGVLFLDLDRFKRINDTLGHNIGDELLKGVGERLRASVRSTDCLARVDVDASESVVARLGGDEFIILLTEIRTVEDGARVAQRILDAMAPPFLLHGQEVSVTVSIGISVYPVDGKDVDSLLKNADTAMYHAKEKGRNNYQFYTESMNARALDRLILENDLRKALEQEQFVLYYQPQIDVPSGQIVGAEALLRWMHPKAGLVPPSDFIPLTEELGLIVPLGEWVLRQACLQGRRWREDGFPSFRVAVNVSARQFQEEDFVATVSRILSETGLPAGNLELELTETVVMKDVDKSSDSLSRLKEMGIRLSIDDFGTGYSSMNYLNRFRLDTLKIDRSFLKGIPKDADHVAIANAIIAMAKGLNLSVVAEGVESTEQLEFLREVNCGGMQGYLVSPPVPIEKFQRLLEDSAPVMSAEMVEPL